MSNKPWSELSARERDARVARALGWVDFWEGEGFIMAYPPNEQAMGIEAERVPIPPFTTDHNAAQQAISEAERLGLQRPYIVQLMEVLDAVPFDDDLWVWQAICASPDQKCEAVVTVLSKPERVFRRATK